MDVLNSMQDATMAKGNQFDSFLGPKSIAKIYAIISHTKIIVIDCNTCRYTFAMEGLEMYLEFICFYKL